MTMVDGAATRVAPEQLARVCDPASLPFDTTADVEPLEGAVGQPRALRALELALGVGTLGYNVFAAGPAGTGKRSTITAYLSDVAARRPTPDDTVYLFNFDDPERPLAVRLPTGAGRALAEDMAAAIDEARGRIPRAFESDDYAERRREVMDELEKRRQDSIDRLEAEARKRGMGVNITPIGVATYPIIEGHPASKEEFDKLAPELQGQIRERGAELERSVEGFAREFRELEREAHERLATLDHEVADFAVGHLIERLETRYADVPAVAGWLHDVRGDILANLDHFRSGDGDGGVPPELVAAIRRGRSEFFSRYVVNVLVGHEPDSGAPVVAETNPTYHRLFGRMDYETAFGAVTTGHTLIRPGAVHRANGGYLLLQAIDVLGQPFVWNKLKEVLRNASLPVENIGSELTLFPTATLNPAPVALDLKVILIGSSRLYELLHMVDEDFAKLFKVKADFDVEIPWDGDEAGDYARFISRQVRDDGLRHFDREAVARTVEHGARVAGDQRKLSSRFIEIADLVVEASHWAERAGHEVVRGDDVRKAIDEREFRANLIDEKIREATTDGTLLFDFAGEAVGQVNGLAVAEVGGHAFGHPMRITATTSAGDGDMVDIDRETELSGPIHDKGFFILSGFLQDRYAREHPLSLRASLVFEQSYSGVEGDSASSAELYALLSSLSGAPLRQDIAVTGSVNQRGEIQAIGGVNEKIEGFFRACRDAGLTGTQGVLIPRSNVRHLMLAPEVIDAVREGRFHVWSVANVDEGIELLTGVPATEIDSRVEERLDVLSEALRKRTAPAVQVDGKPVLE